MKTSFSTTFPTPTDIPSTPLANQPGQSLDNSSTTSSLYQRATEWWYGTQEPSQTSPRFEKDKRSVDTLENPAVTEFVCKTLSPNFGWKKLDIKNQMTQTVGPKGSAQSFYTELAQPITIVNSRTIQPLESYINTAAWYGARLWNNQIWFSSVSADNNSVGLLSVQNTPQGDTKYLPLKDLGEDVFPILVPSHSVPGPKGYACVFESQLGLLGFSLWDINSVPPEKLLQEQGYETINFVGDHLAFAYREKTKALECWNLKTKKMEYQLEGWHIDTDPVYMNLGPCSKDKKMLLGDNGLFIYGFNLENKDVAYILQMKSLSGIGVFHKILAGENSFLLREYSSAKVSVRDINTGYKKYAFQIGGAVDSMDTDDFPMRVYGDTIFSLTEDGDRREISSRTVASGNILTVFEPAQLAISGIYCTENRVIGACFADANLGDVQDQIVIWDATTGKIRKTISAPKGYSLSPRDLSNGKLTIRVEKNRSEENCKNKSRIVEKTFKENLRKMWSKPSGQNALKPDSETTELPDSETTELLDLQKKPYVRNYQEFSDEKGKTDWTNPIFMFVDNELELQVWDVESCTCLGSIKENFVENPAGPVTVSYSNGKLVADNNMVLVQHYNI